MTAEIAIVNRSSVTLAADSAMTMFVGGQKKIYTSTDKIFELSDKDPIGFMVYNNLEFINAPIDVLVKQFRNSTHCCQFSTLAEAPKAFFTFLSTEWMPSEPLQQKHARDILLPLYEDVFDKFFGERNNLFRGRANKNPKPIDILLQYVSAEVERLEQCPPSDCFVNCPEEHIIGFYADTLDGLTKDIFHSPPLDEDGKILCRRLGGLALHRDVFSDAMSGFVFAGFGQNDTFPSLLHYETDGIIANCLKTRMSDNITMGREKISAKVLPFAQRDVVDRFLAGIDPQLQDGIAEYLERTVKKTKESLWTAVKGVPRKAKAAVEENVDQSLGELVSSFSPWLENVKRAYSKETEDMILFMAKPEAAHLAESLVNITSLKRKYSAGEESVAGPIDVAVISKGEGFVWVKRKHYFPAELNQRYLHRKFGKPITERKPGDA